MTEKGFLCILGGIGSGIQKEPKCSSVEVARPAMRNLKIQINGIVHVYLAGIGDTHTTYPAKLFAKNCFLVLSGYIILKMIHK